MQKGTQGSKQAWLGKHKLKVAKKRKLNILCFGRTPKLLWCCLMPLIPLRGSVKRNDHTEGVVPASPTTTNTWKVWIRWLEVICSSIVQRHGGGGSSSSFNWLSDATMHTPLQGVLEERHSQPSTRDATKSGNRTCHRNVSRQGALLHRPYLREPYLSTAVRNSQKRRIWRKTHLSTAVRNSLRREGSGGSVHCHLPTCSATFLQCHNFV